jgi:hypothetical protein
MNNWFIPLRSSHHDVSRNKSRSRAESQDYTIDQMSAKLQLPTEWRPLGVPLRLALRDYFRSLYVARTKTSCGIYLASWPRQLVFSVQRPAIHGIRIGCALELHSSHEISRHFVRESRTPTTIQLT